MMRFGIEVVTLGDFGEPAAVVRLARAAEAAGWEALFVWDHLAFVWGVPAGDPWVILAAVAMATERLLLGVGVTPLPRRRPHVVAHAATTLDRLSGGRLVLGVGLGGVPEEFTAFGEPGEARVRAAMLDEGLSVLDGLLRGERVVHHGAHYRVDGVTLAPRPVQQPRPPIWIGGDSRPALRRAAQWDGWIIGIGDEQGQITRSPEAVAESVATIKAQRRDEEQPFTVALTSGYTAGPDDETPLAYAAVGAGWWLESLHGFRGNMEEMLERVAAGPPRGGQ